MDLEHCVIAVTNELARFLSAADKTPLQRLSYMSCRPPLTLAGFGVFDGAKLQLFPDIERKKNPASQKTSRNKDEEIVILFLLTNL